METPNFDIENADITEVITRLRWAKDAWKSEIPSEILSGASPDKMYKVRKNWWVVLLSHLQFYCLPLLSDHTHRALKEKIHAFLKKYQCKEFVKRLTTKEDIDTAESLIDDVLSVLENLQNTT